jgi:hypothetical protein
MFSLLRTESSRETTSVVRLCPKGKWAKMRRTVDGRDLSCRVTAGVDFRYNLVEVSGLGSQRQAEMMRITQTHTHE